MLANCPDEVVNLLEVEVRFAPGCDCVSALPVARLRAPRKRPGPRGRLATGERNVYDRTLETASQGRLLPDRGARRPIWQPSWPIVPHMILAPKTPFPVLPRRWPRARSRHSRRTRAGDGGAASGRPMTAHRAPGVRLGQARDPCGLQQPAEQGATASRRAADHVGVRSRRRGHGGIVAPRAHARGHEEQWHAQAASAAELAGGCVGVSSRSGRRYSNAPPAPVPDSVLSGSWYAVPSRRMLVSAPRRRSDCCLVSRAGARGPRRARSASACW